MFCEKCGEKQPDNAIFCSSCGNKIGGLTSTDPIDKTAELKEVDVLTKAAKEQSEPVVPVKTVQVQPVPVQPIPVQQAPIQQAQVQQVAPQAIQQAAPAQRQVQQTQPQMIDPLTKPLSVGGYMGMLIVLAIPIVGFIMTFVWLFSSNTNKNKKNFIIAMIIITIIMIVVSFLLSGIIIAVLSPLLQDFQNNVY